MTLLLNITLIDVFGIVSVTLLLNIHSSMCLECFNITAVEQTLMECLNNMVLNIHSWNV